MKKAYLIHGWGLDSTMPWMVWLKNELEKRGFKVIAFDMPNTNQPKIEDWVDYLKTQISPEDFDEHTYFVGHSVGCQTIMRFLEKSHKHKRIGGCVFVGGWFDLINLNKEELEIAHPWINEHIHFERVLDHCNNFLAIFSDNDQYVHLDEVEKFKEKLDAKTIILKEKNHFEKVEQIEEILHFIK